MSSPFEKGGLRGILRFMERYSQKLKENSRSLRANMTDAEQVLWQRIRRKQIQGVQFYRQKPLLAFIVDFYCPTAKLVIELDGSQHFTEEHQTKDQERDAALTGLGLRVLRFDNRQVLLETDAVLEMIDKIVKDRARANSNPP
ncbi:MAG: endonuclease domain-containing protein [Desulfurivibrionaceae bacterium]|jgi:very-short-patch-repair endonuclease